MLNARLSILERRLLSGSSCTCYIDSRPATTSSFVPRIVLEAWNRKQEDVRAQVSAIRQQLVALTGPRTP